jgi:hypothetical protein
MRDRSGKLPSRGDCGPGCSLRGRAGWTSKSTTTFVGSIMMGYARTSGEPSMVERRGPVAQYPLTADLAGVLAVAQHERAEDIRRFFAWLFRAGWLFRRRVTGKPLDSTAAVR